MLVERSALFISCDTLQFKLTNTRTEQRFFCFQIFFLLMFYTLIVYSLYRKFIFKMRVIRNDFNLCEFSIFIFATVNRIGW